MIIFRQCYLPAINLSKLFIKISSVFQVTIYLLIIILLIIIVQIVSEVGVKTVEIHRTLDFY